MKLSPKQKEFWNNCNKRWNIKSGATRSGKTYLDYYVIAKRIRACEDNGLIVLLGNTQGTLERNILDPMRSIWGDKLVGHISSNNKVKLFGREAYALGADKKNQVARIQGAGIEYCYGDEITTWSEPVFQMLKSRLDKPNSCFDGTCNPDSPNHWFKTFLESNADIFHQHYIIDDNPFLTEKFVRELKKEYAGTVFYNRYILGQWVRAEGVIYPMFSREKHVVPSINRNYEQYYISVDYGTYNPTSAGLWGLCEGKWYRVNEYYYDGRARGIQRTDEEHYKAIKILAGDKSIRKIIVDPSAASFIEVIRRDGQYYVEQASNRVIDGIRDVAVHLNAGDILICDICKDCIREFEGYCWDDKSIEDRPIKENDHAMDDLRYFVRSAFNADRFSF